jgi:chromosome segregation ATPase
MSNDLIKEILNEIKGIKQSMATKSELGDIKQSMATKSELGDIKQSMATKSELGDIKQSMATKSELGDIKQSMATKSELGDIKAIVQRIETKQNVIYDQTGNLTEHHTEVMDKMDSISKSIDDKEYATNALNKRLLKIESEIERLNEKWHAQ